MRPDFALFILSHGRPRFARLHTVNNILRSGYTGDWFIVLDTEDPTIAEYEEEFGVEHIVTFTKDDGAQDLGDNHLGPRGVIIYARNAAPKIAAARGYRYLMQLDDDYFGFGHRFTLNELIREGASERDVEAVRGHARVNPNKGRGGFDDFTLSYCATTQIDRVIELLIDFMETSDALTVAWAQGGDFIGGARGAYRRRILRKAMNAFLMRSDDPPHFVGRINEDVTTYVTEGGRGKRILTVVDFGFSQTETQSSEGGMAGAYLDFGTYLKSFYTVMYAPSAVKVVPMGEVQQRLHHRVNWEHAVPKIISGAYRKPDRVRTE